MRTHNLFICRFVIIQSFIKQNINLYLIPSFLFSLCLFMSTCWPMQNLSFREQKFDLICAHKNDHNRCVCWCVRKIKKTKRPAYQITQKDTTNGSKPKMIWTWQRVNSAARITSTRKNSFWVHSSKNRNFHHQ